MVSRVLFSSASEEWETPADLIEVWGPFDLDVCATPENAKAPCYYTKADDGLSAHWYGRVWCNPPYGRASTGRWVSKAVAQLGSQNVTSITMLLPARTDTRWFHGPLYGNPCAKIHFLRGRLKFSGAKNAAPFPSMIVVLQHVQD